MRPGIYLDMDDKTYRALPFLNWSRLKHVLTAPAKAKHVSDMGQTVVTEAMRHGTRVHTACLQPELWTETYKVSPEIRKRELRYQKTVEGWWIRGEDILKGPYKTKGEAVSRAPVYTFDGDMVDGHAKQADAKQAIAERFKGFQLMTAEQHKKAMNVAEAVYSHPAASDLLFSDINTELTMVWVETMADGHEILCKGRADGYSRAENLMIDLKTCPSSDLREFRFKVIKWQYHAQLAFYARGLELAARQSNESGPWTVDRLGIIAVEHEPPHLVSFFELGPAMTATGQELAQTALELWSACEVTGMWPGRSPEIVTMELYR